MAWLAVVDWFFANPVAYADACRWLGDPIAPGRRRVRLAPRDPRLAGVVLWRDGDRIDGIELEPAAAVAPAAFEAHLGAPVTIAPLHAHAAPVLRYPCRGPAYHGFVLVEPGRIAMRRFAPDAWLGDFTRPDDAVAIIRLFLDRPALTPGELHDLIGHPADDCDLGEGERSVTLEPFAGSNLASARICHRPGSPSPITRLELGLHAPRVIDLRALAPRAVRAQGPNPSLREHGHIQYLLECPTAAFLGFVLLDTPDERPSVQQLVRSMILHKVRPGEPVPFRALPAATALAIEGLGSALRS
jgi:hypothetical protein